MAFIDSSIHTEKLHGLAQVDMDHHESSQSLKWSVYTQPPLSTISPTNVDIDVKRI